MYLSRLDLESFGHFDHQTVDLDHPVGGLRFIVGPNEAGKSAIRAAIRFALFGHSGRTIAGSPLTDVRISIDFTSAEQAGKIVRRGGAAPRDDTGATIQDAELNGYVGIAPELFDGLFCLGHDELRRYAHGLIQATGGLGSIVFGAALGGPAVKRVSDHLQGELDKRFKSKSRKLAINNRIAELKNTDDRLSELTVTADAWVRGRTDIERLKDKTKELAEEISKHRKEISRLERVQLTRPNLTQRHKLYDELTELLASGAAAENESARLIDDELLLRDKAADDLEHRTADLEEHNEMLGAIPPGSQALNRADEIERLTQRVGQYREALAAIDTFELNFRDATSLQRADALDAVAQDTTPRASDADRIAALEPSVARQATDITSAKATCGLSNLPDDDILSCRVPTATEIERARVDMFNRAETMHRLNGEFADAEKLVAETRDALEQLEQVNSVPTAEQIRSVRTERDRVWNLIRRWFVDGVEPPSTTETAQQHADDFEHRTGDADRLVDVVLNDTDRAASAKSLRMSLGQHQQRSIDVQEQQLLLDGANDAALKNWLAVWEAVPCRLGPPEEMSEWRKDWENLCTAITTHLADTTELATQNDRVSDATTALRDALTESGVPPAPTMRFTSLLQTANELVDGEKRRREQAAAVTAARNLRNDVDSAIKDLQSALGADPEVGGDRAIGELEKLRSEQEAMQRERTRLQQEIIKATTAIKASSEALSGSTRRLDALASDLGIGVEDLGAAVQRGTDTAELRSRIDDLESLLIGSGAGFDIDALVAESEAAGESDALTARIAELGDLTDAISEARDEKTQQLAIRTQAFDAIAGQNDAADVADRREAAMTGLADLVDETTVFALARNLLARVVDEAGSGSQGALIDRAAHYFSLLTNGEFVGLEIEMNGDDVYAVAVRSDQSRLYVPALSDGTQDQLWFALRLAGIEHHIDRVGPMPVIVDDVFVHFDDGRASAACAALVELSQFTQVVVLTHHPHLVGIARDRIGTENVAVTQLEPRPTRARPITQMVARDDALVQLPVDLPTAPRSAASARTTPSSTTLLEGSRQAVLAALDPTELRGKADVIVRSGIDDGDWQQTIRSLVDDGLVEQQGVKRGAKYRTPLRSG